MQYSTSNGYDVLPTTSILTKPIPYFCIPSVFQTLFVFKAVCPHVNQSMALRSTSYTHPQSLSAYNPPPA
jgi:hypothetical protein